MNIEIANRQKALRWRSDVIRRTLEAALEAEGRDADLSVALVGNEEMAALNERFLGRSGPTDVLAFPYGDEGGLVSGEIVVNAELALRQAEGRGHSATDELLLYLVHGALHLLGYDDRAPAGRRRMRERERQVLSGLGRKIESRRPRGGEGSAGRG